MTMNTSPEFCNCYYFCTLGFFFGCYSFVSANTVNAPFSVSSVFPCTPTVSHVLQRFCIVCICKFPHELMRNPDKRVRNTYVMLVHLLHCSENKHSVLTKYTHNYMLRVHTLHLCHTAPLMGRQTGPLGSGWAGDFSNENTKSEL